MTYEKKNEKLLMSKTISIFLKKMRKDKPFSLPDDLIRSKRILFFDSGDMTDILFAAPMVNWFRDYYPDIKLMMLVDRKHAGVAKSVMRLNTIISYEPKQMKILKSDYMALSRKLKKEQIDTTILISRQMSLERYLLAFLSGARIRIGFAHPMAFPFINCEVRVSEDSYIGNSIVRLLGAMGLGVKECDRRITLPAADIAHARQLIHFRKPEKGVITVGIDPGKSKTRHNVIPEIMIYLANNLAGRLKLKFLVLMNPVDMKTIERFTGELKGEVIDLEQMGISETLALLSQCDLFMTGNTDLFHFSAALDVPTLAVFTRYDDKNWVPDYASNVRVFKGVKGEKLSLKSFFSKVEEVLATKEGITI
ncbi:MAG: glycosyltransferase family 9 protein [Candidatus Krumholzibacteriota bacterium]|nr:glycosyltransferase family 9 protein [Candidatus Krumholzibacteriota bacterium]